MNPQAAKRLRLLASAISLLLLLALLTAGWFYWRLRGSLPQLDGTASMPGLAAKVTITRDAQGVPTIQAESRDDVSRALGWLHGQDRFFQMDVLRRVAAGELSALFGQRALTRDRTARMHGFRRIAQAALQRLPAGERSALEAYAAGVNAGLTALSAHPFEYLVLRESPEPWRAEDSLLVVFAMTIDLQDEKGIYERTLMTLRDELGRDALAFFAPVVTPFDAALDGSEAATTPIPNSRLINLRARKAGATDPGADNPFRRLVDTTFGQRDPEAVMGSNAFALAGSHTASGAALLANDMHLDHGVPNIWYRAVLAYGGRRVVGVTLPGAPAVVAGSNGHVAWGFTNSCIDTSDVITVDVNSIATFMYPAPGHEKLLEIEKRRETIQVKGGKPVTEEYQWTIWGPILATNEQQRPLALRWVSHDPEATNLALLDLEQANTVDEAIAVAHRAGIPAQNIVLADRSGEIAWTIAGRVPKRIGYDGRLPVSWSFGDRRWEGYLSSAETPVVRGRDTVQAGRIWSANQRHVGGESLAKLGEAGYRRATRATQIRDGLAALSKATPKDLLAVQLDDRALFLEPWHKLLLATLSPEVTNAKKSRAALRSYAEKWEGRASTDAISYWLAREFRVAVYGRVFPPIFADCKEAFEDFSVTDLQLEPAMWALLREKPMHLLNPEFASWEDLLVAACDDVIAFTDKQGMAMDKATWGWRNRARIRHPFSYSFPFLADWLDMPQDPLPGGDDMPRLQAPSHGASERLVVSPGREDEGIFHMPGGQSGHPLSPFYRAGHDAWVRGTPSPLLPGKPVHTLVLQR